MHVVRTNDATTSKISMSDASRASGEEKRSVTLVIITLDMPGHGETSCQNNCVKMYCWNTSLVLLS